MAEFFINRQNRKRHATADCRGLEQTRSWLEMMLETGYFDGVDEEEIPTYETRVVRVETTDPDELAAIEAFTIPCQLCVPGARELARRLSFVFES